MSEPLKRYNTSPLRYPGGKSRAARQIALYLPKDLKRLVSPFFGGGSFEFYCALELGIQVKAFDIFDILVNFWNEVIFNGENLSSELEKLEPTKEVYKEVKQRLQERFENKICGLNTLELARDYYFNWALSYGPMFLGWMAKIYEDKTRYARIINKLCNFYLDNKGVLRKNVGQVVCADFEKAFREYSNDFFYCDPPYYLGGNSKVFTGIYPSRNKPIHHKNFKHERLATLLKSHKKGFILSYNDCDFVRETYKDFKIVELKWQYSMGLGETRIGKNRRLSGNDNVKSSHELLIIKEA